MEGQSIDDLLDFINDDTKEATPSKKKNKKKKNKEESKQENKKEEIPKEEKQEELKNEEEKKEISEQKEDEKELDEDQKEEEPHKKKKKKKHHKKKKQESEDGPRENPYRKYTNWKEQGIEITNSRFQDNSQFRLLGSWKEGEWTQTNYPTKDIDELFPDKKWPVGIIEEYSSE